MCCRILSEWSRNAGRRNGLTVYCSACMKEDGAVRRKAKAVALLRGLGGVCVRCGEKDLDVLSVDHVHGGGAAERRVLPSTSARFREKALANPDDYRVLCLNCQWIVKDENGQHAYGRRASRTVPTERKRGIGKGNAPGQRANVGGGWWATASPEQIAARNAKISAAKRGVPNPKVAEARQGTKKVDGRWVRADGIPLPPS